MRFGIVHRIMTDALAVLGLLALLTSGELATWITVALAVGALAALAIPERWQDADRLRRVGFIAPLALLTLEAARFTTGVDSLSVAVEFAAGLQVVRLATRRGAAHDQQIIVLALLHLIAATVLGGGLAYGLCFLGFLVVAPGALVLSHLRREVEGNYRQGARDRTGLPVDVPRILRSRRVIGRHFLLFTCFLSIPIFLFTAFLFVLFPRVGLSLLLLNHNRPDRMIGFSDRVDLGGVGKLRTDPSIAMRVEFTELPPVPPPRLALYLRGTAFDAYDGRTWVRTVNHRRLADLASAIVPVRRAPILTDRTLTVDLEPIDPPVLFLPDETVSFALLAGSAPLLGREPRVFSGPEGQFQYLTTDDSGVRYRVYLGPSATPAALSAADRARYLSLPPGLPHRVRTLAAQWAQGSSGPLASAVAIQRHLHTEYTYDLESPSGGASDPLDHFLFQSHRGHCEFYSTAMAVLLRTLDIPTRNVTGFVGGTYNRFGRYYAVRQGDAHSWVEVYLPDTGWTRFDPTPPASSAPQSEVHGALALFRDVFEAAAQRWSRNVRGYDLSQQLQLFSSVRSNLDQLNTFRNPFASPRKALITLVTLALITAAAYWIYRRFPRIRRRRAGDAQPLDPIPDHVIALYQALEGAMATRGVPRQPATPPLAHALALRALRHPIADEVHSLTQVYLGARFGGMPLSHNDRHQFLHRVRDLRRNRGT